VPSSATPTLVSDSSRIPLLLGVKAAPPFVLTRRPSDVAANSLPGVPASKTSRGMVCAPSNGPVNGAV
jgi:hypothetical protein